YLGRARRTSLFLRCERERDSPAQAPGRVRSGQLLAVERRPLEEVRQLLAVARVVEGELLVPRQPLGVSRRARSPPRRRVRARTRSAAPAPRRGGRAAPPSARGSEPPSRRQEGNRGRAARPRSASRRSSSAPPRRAPPGRARRGAR